MALHPTSKRHATDTANAICDAQTVAGTVMAEQINHNVVNGHESASASALADAAANLTDATFALGGTTANTNQPQDFLLPPSEKAANIDSSGDPLIIGVASQTADPSAGDAATLLANDVDIPNETSAQSLLDPSAGAVTGDTPSTDLVADDGSVVDSLADHSVNSDTDVSRADGSDVRKDETGQAKGSLVKKPTTFSKVSVTKTFLAKAATPQPIAAKLGQKPPSASVSPQPVPRPRLVAKTGSSLQNAQKAGLGTAGTTGPDASKVWNKNRPVAPVPPKQLTDEQLKQQYGIHLATRLQTNEGGKDSTWADIDDDDDDWAPETVTWVDGTKSSLTPAETPVVPPVPAKSTSPVQPPKNPDAPKPTLVARRAVESVTPKTILKPGIAAQQAKQQQTTATTGEKPILKGKGPAPAPAKSPWAPVPAIEAVSPINPPVQQVPTPTPIAQILPPQDARAYDSPITSQPAREIAADTFDRSDLGTRAEGGSRELFNSSNGRYEPAPERRSSLRPERKTAVLQRPSQGGSSPTEGVQPRNGAQSASPWGRQRGSSMSQDARESARRGSTNSRGKESQTSNDASGHAGDAAIIPSESTHPSFSQQSPWDSQMPQRPEAADQGPLAEDPVKVQERIMREKREMAIRRRKEQEDREEAERKERLQAKLDALAGAGKSRKEREAEAAEKKSEPAVTDAPAANAEEARPIPGAKSSQTGSVQSQPSAQTQEKSVSQQEEEKTTAAETVDVGKLASPQQPKAKPAHAERLSHAADQAQPAPRTQQTSPATAGRAGFSQPAGAYKSPSTNYQAPGDSKPQAFGRSPLTNNDAFSPWGTTPSNGNIWGSSGMGNGTFEKSSAFAPLPLQHSSILPPPLGMSLPGSARISPEAQGQEGAAPNTTRTQPSEPLRNFPPGIDARAESNWGAGRTAGAAQASSVARPPHGPGPIAPPSRAQAQQTQPPAGINPRANGVAAWNRAAQTLPYQYASDANATESSPPESQPMPTTTIKETFRKTNREPTVLGGRRQYESTEYTVHDPKVSHGVANRSPAPPSAQTQPTGPFSASSTLDAVSRPMGEAATLAPIGPPHRAVLSTSPANVNFPTAPLPSLLDSRDASQPPPETISHPVNQASSVRPKVRLPPPPPVVKLPPAYTRPAVPTTTATTQRPYNTWGPPGAARPIAQTADWQARFNGLFNRTPIHTEVPPSPPGTPPKVQGAALAVASSSKASLVDSARVPAATVSLPLFQKAETTPMAAVGLSQDVVTKPPIEPAFNEELSFGSLPKVRLPRNPKYLVDFSAKGEQDLLKRRLQTKPDTGMQAQTISIELYFYKAPQGYYLRIPGTKLNNMLVRHSAEIVKPMVHGDRKPSSRHPRSKARDVTQPGIVAGGPVSPAAKPARAHNPASSPAVAQTPTSGEHVKRRTSGLKPPKTRSPVVKT